MGCTEAEWLGWLPTAMGPWPWRREGREAWVDFDAPPDHLPCPRRARLHLSWQVLAPRAIALLRLPRLGVRFEFQEVDATTRQAFMQRFDLRMQRGGG